MKVSRKLASTALSAAAVASMVTMATGPANAGACPSPTSSQIVIHDNWDCTGGSHNINQNYSNLGVIGGWNSWNERTSAVTIPPNHSVFLYKHKGYKEKLWVKTNSTSYTQSYYIGDYANSAGVSSLYQCARGQCGNAPSGK